MKSDMGMLKVNTGDEYSCEKNVCGLGGEGTLSEAAAEKKENMTRL